ncbi:MAG TPA: SAVMC3_10250 family protein [Thermoleophilaceae bacterium]
MPEVLYVSTAKLKRWIDKETLRSSLGRRVGGEVGGGPIPGKVTLAADSAAHTDDRSAAAEYSHVVRALKELNASHRFPRWVTDTSVGPGQYIEFAGPMRYGRVHRDTRSRDASAPSANIVFFVGAFEEGDTAVDLLLGGWRGHLVEHRGNLEDSLRMGSQTEHLYDLWDELVARERDGDFHIPEVWRRLRREPAPNASPTLASLCRAVYSWMSRDLLNRAYLKGTAQVLDRLDDSGYDKPLIVATPLVVEFSAPE